MQDVNKSATELLASVQAAMGKLKIDDLATQLIELEAKSSQADFWSDNLQAQEVMKQKSSLEVRVKPWQKLEAAIKDIVEMASLGDASLADDLTNQLTQAQKDFDDLRGELKFAGPHDSYNAILSIYAGAGGTDAQDWAQMLLRMYVRWAEKHDVEVKSIDQSDGEEAGIKSVSMQLSGKFVYGQLKSEHGVHRLVRLSPFNSDNLRQTSFAKVEVLPQIDQPNEVEIDDKDLKIDVFRSGGKGGQSVNTTDSAVRVTHLPTNIVVSIQNERSQLQNKETAMTILRSKLAQLSEEQHQQNVRDLKGPNEQAAWGNQIRSYVLHPYKQVKDLRTRYETSDIDGVLDGNLDDLIDAYLEHSLGG